MKTNKPASSKTEANSDNIKAARTAVLTAKLKSETAGKVASLAKGRYKVAKKSYKLARKAAKRAAKEAKRARKRLEASLKLAAKQQKKKSPEPKAASKPVKPQVSRKTKSKSAVRKITATKRGGNPAASASVSIPPPTTPPDPLADSTK